MAAASAFAQESATSSGTYSADQAERGAALYSAHCAACHGVNLEGGIATPLSGQIFRVTWSRPNVTVDDLHFITSTTMPQLQGGSLTQTEYLEILAFVLQQNDVPAGATPVTNDRQYLASIRMAPDDVVSLSTAPSYVEGDRGITPLGTGPGHEELSMAAADAGNWLYHTRD
ncbi:MAG TPA: cytochrome c, partial [Gammaproteobacteria bacterium]|nr:cytochrome c [Gammaproteobacteria bacterium]